MKTLFKNARVVLENRIEEDYSLLIENDHILAYGPNTFFIDNYDLIIDVKNQFISPGFIDLHVHGGGGADFMDHNNEKFKIITQAHAKHGMTACLATTLSSLNEEVFELLEKCPKEDENLEGARILGVHLEGPYFSMEQRGAQDPMYIKTPQVEEVNEFLKYKHQIKRWSMAVELENMDKIIPIIKQNNILVSLAHTSATAQEVIKSEDWGVSLATHFYSGMGSIYRIKGLRAAGAVEGVYLSKSMIAEIIADGKHLPKELIQMIYKFLGAKRVILTTDAMRAAGTDHMESILGSLEKGQRVIIKDGVAKLPDETSLAGSIATMDRLLKTVLDAGISMVDGVNSISLLPAKLIHVDDRYGKIEPNYKADFVIFDDDINIISTYINGKCVYHNA
ncbi:MAG: N-acetylglucosamine-6-phosphate deacetylase [Acholeplasmataceae bacterium]|jgi:N-acetylglucosamine-6-phosphate deacetylase|nr:N-acetylglucosamine-6-phosphate deacetylase [Acholeplasmataceae bacterium]